MLEEKMDYLAKKEKIEKYIDDWDKRKRVIVCFIDQENEDRWFHFYTGVEVACIKEGVILYERTENSYYKVIGLVFCIDAAELYVYVETYSPNKVLSLKKRFDLKLGPEGRLDNSEKNKEKSKLSDELNLSYFL